jgi:hypothetical protein
MSIRAWALTHPLRQIRDVMRPAVHPPRTGLTAILGLGVLYTLTCVGLYIGGAEPLAPPVLQIALRDYYLWLAFSLTDHRLAHALGGRGDSRTPLDGTGIICRAHEYRCPECEGEAK